MTDHQDHDNDRHIWTSPLNAIRLAEDIRDALVKHDPEYRSFYEKNYLSLESDLLELDRFIRDEFKQLRHRYLIVSHPSWGFFADTYSLKQISIEQHGSEVRARALVHLIELAKKENIKTVFVQKQFNTVSAEILAREINGRLIELDPLAPDYIENLRRVARLIVEGAR